VSIKIDTKFNHNNKVIGIVENWLDFGIIQKIENKLIDFHNAIKRTIWG